MECKGQELKSMVYSRDGEVSSGIGTEKAGAGSRQLWAGEVGRNQSPQGWLCQSRIWGLGVREPGEALGRRMA